MRDPVVFEIPVPVEGEIKIDGLRFAPEVFSYLVPKSGEWRGPIWLRRSADVVEITTVDPGGEGWVSGFKIGEGT